MKVSTLLNVVFLMVFLVQGAYAADKKIGVLVFDGVLTSDVTAPLEVFGVASTKSWFSSYDVITIGVTPSASIKTEEGLKLGVDAHIAQSPEVDVLIVPSAYEMDHLIGNKQLISYIEKIGKQAEWMASNCSGAHLLAEAGLLDGKSATTWRGGEGELKKSYPKVDVVFNQNMVIDDKVITSNGSIVSYQSALALLKRIASQSKAEEVAEAIQYQSLSSKHF